ncbi:unnamed protein product [Prunus brigantina]
MVAKAEIMWWNVATPGGTPWAVLRRPFTILIHQKVSEKLKNYSKKKKTSNPLGSYPTQSLFLSFSSSLSPSLRHPYPPPSISLLLWLNLIGLDKLGFLGLGNYGFGPNGPLRLRRGDPTTAPPHRHLRLRSPATRPHLQSHPNPPPSVTFRHVVRPLLPLPPPHLIRSLRNPEIPQLPRPRH